MFIAIDLRTNNFILSIDEQDNRIDGNLINNKNINYIQDNYKDTYNKELRFKCIDDNCNDILTFVNSIQKTPHFRHSSKDKSNNCLPSNFLVSFIA